MTDKEKIRKEVEKIARSINPYIPDEEGKNSEYEAGRFAMATQIMQIIDSLQEEPVSEGLEKAAVEAFKKIVDSDKNNFLEIFKAGAEWKKANLWKDAQGDDLEAEIIRYIGYPQEVDEDICTTMIRKAARHFAEWQKQQMMKDAVEYKVMDLHENKDGESVPSIIVDLPKSFDFGDKVKVIIIKED